MFDDDHAAIAAALDFSASIAMWRAARETALPDFTSRPYFSKRSVAPMTFAALLTLVNVVLLGCTLLPASAIF